MSSALLQYYIYAQNAQAGKFSPQRAEHEFYALHIPGHTVSKGALVINEILASNKESDPDEAGHYGDWIELYNTSDTIVSLNGLYLSDSYTAPAKYAIPAGITIQAKSYYMIWADEKYNTAKYLHTGFKLSGDGEELMLSNGMGTIIDSITFGPQQEDISFGRCPNGTGSFAYIRIPTFKESNVFCTSGIESITSRNGMVKAYPNPTSGIVVFETREIKSPVINMYNSLGEAVGIAFIENGTGKMDLKELPHGIYFYQAKDHNGRISGQGKILLIHQ